MNTRLIRITLLSIFATFLVAPALSAAANENDVYAAATPDRVAESDLAIGLGYDSHTDKGPEAGVLTGDMFGGGGYVHPFLSVSEGYSDNVYNVATAATSDWFNVISPGIWLALPGSREQLLNLSTTNTSPGGLAFSRDQNESFQRYQAYLLYQADVMNYSSQSAADTDHHRLEGLLQLNLKGGLTFDLVDEYKIASDPLATGVSSTLDEYKTNMLDSILTYDVSEKFSLSAGGGLYTLDYDEDVNASRDRQDTKYNAKINYHLSSKTALFIDYKFINVAYDLATISDSDMQFGYGGVKWDLTAKSTGKLSAGYIGKKFDAVGKDDVSEFGFELQMAHEFTPKTSVELVADRKIAETTIDTTDYILTHKVSLTYLQQITSKISVNLFVFYGKDQYQGPITVAGDTKERDDDTYIVAPGIDYKIADWLLTGISYSYTERDSNFDTFDYKNNSYLARITLFL